VITEIVNNHETREEVSIDIDHDMVDEEVNNIEEEEEEDNVISSENATPVSNEHLQNEEEINFDYDQYYDTSRGQPIENLDLTIGSNRIPRYSCANHKLNLAVRHALETHQVICRLIRRITRHNSHIRNCINLNRTFRINKARLRLDNVTRWSSAYLVLKSVKKAYDKNLFDQNDPELRCPVDKKTVETYLQILKPAYTLNLFFQKSNSSISDTIIGIIM
jgi:hypothetical protein